MGLSFYWIDIDDNEEQLGDTANRVVSRYSGLGAAPSERFLQAIPSQHRQKHLGLRFRPRIVQLLINDKRSTVAAQQSAANTLLARLNPDKGAGELKILLDDGTERRLDCMAIAGPELSQENRLGAGALRSYLVRFLARDPLFYDPTQNSENDNFNGATPVDIAVTNSGHIGAYPTIVFAAGVQNPKIELVSTGEYIHFDSYTVPVGDNLTVDCWAGTAELDDETNKIGELKKESTMFYLPRGASTLRLTCTAGTSAATVTWYSRFLGI